MQAARPALGFDPYAVLPPRVETAFNETIGAYWADRVAQHLEDSYVDVPLLKFPEDLRVYEHLLWNVQANVVIEIGTHSGGSALWFRDRLRTFAAYGRIAEPLVITIDVDIAAARRALQSVDPSCDRIVLVEGDARDESLPDEVRRLLPANARCLVIDDSAHTYATTSASLTGFAQFVPRGGFFVVEDGCVDVEEMRVDSQWPRGVIEAIGDFLSSPEGRDFELRRDMECYGITCHVGGYLQRK